MTKMLFTLIVGACIAQNSYAQAKPHPMYTCRLPLPTQLSDSANIVGIKLTQGAPVNAELKGGVGWKCGARVYEELLYIIDGVLETADVFQRLNPDDIETIDILKEAATTALIGCRRGRSNVIIVTTNRMYTRLKIVDSLNGQAIPYASVTISANNTKADQIFVADSNGFVRISRQRLQRISSILASSVSYITKQVSATGLPNYPVISLQRKASTNEAVTVTSGTIQYRKRTSCGGVSVRGKQLIINAAPANNITFKAYPNPVQAGQATTVQVQVPQGTVASLQLVSLQGQVVQQWRVNGGEGVRTLQAPVNTTCTPGLYMLVHKNETGKVLNSVKLVVQ